MDQQQPPTSIQVMVAKAPRRMQQPRITNVCNTYYGAPGHPGLLVPTSWGIDLESDEQPYQRWITVTEQPTPIDLGWLADCKVACLAIVNEEGKNLQLRPTPEEQADINSRIVDVSNDLNTDPFLFVAPGRGVSFQPFNPSKLRIKCRSGKARCLITAFPE